jgi:hypothetical protein
LFCVLRTHAKRVVAGRNLGIEAAALRIELDGNRHLLADLIDDLQIHAAVGKVTAHQA